MVEGIRAYFNGLDFQTKMHSGQNKASKIGNFYTKSMWKLIIISTTV